METPCSLYCHAVVQSEEREKGKVPSSKVHSSQAGDLQRESAVRLCGRRGTSPRSSTQSPPFALLCAHPSAHLGISWTDYSYQVSVPNL